VCATDLNLARNGRHPALRLYAICVGAVIAATGGLRKARFNDPRRNKGKRGGLRVIYFWWQESDQFWLFTLYDKNEMDALTPKQREALAHLLDLELKARRKR
jgi:hypothetical protein